MASVIDVPQLITGYAKVKKVEKPKAVEYVIDEVLKYVKERGDKVGEAHIHWYRDSRNLRNLMHQYHIMRGTRFINQ